VICFSCNLRRTVVGTQLGNLSLFHSGRLWAWLIIGGLSLIILVDLTQPVTLGSEAGRRSVLWPVLRLITGLLFLMWTHRVYLNLTALGAVYLEYSPGWAVGAFFVPVLSLWRPYQVFREIWAESDPGAVIAGDSWTLNLLPISQSRSAPALMQFWWAAYLVKGITVSGIRFENRVQVAALALEIVAAVLAILVIYRIDQRQHARFRVMSAMAHTTAG
jgi:hypothetical protein